MASLAFTAIKVLKNTVEVGFVDGINAATTPIGQAISKTNFSCGLVDHSDRLDILDTLPHLSRAKFIFYFFMIRNSKSSLFMSQLA